MVIDVVHKSPPTNNTCVIFKLIKCDVRLAAINNNVKTALICVFATNLSVGMILGDINSAMKKAGFINAMTAIKTPED